MDNTNLYERILQGEGETPTNLKMNNRSVDLIFSSDIMDSVPEKSCAVLLEKPIVIIQSSTETKEKRCLSSNGSSSKMERSFSRSFEMLKIDVDRSSHQSRSRSQHLIEHNYGRTRHRCSSPPLRSPSFERDRRYRSWSKSPRPCSRSRSPIYRRSCFMGKT